MNHTELKRGDVVTFSWMPEGQFIQCVVLQNDPVAKELSIIRPFIVIEGDIVKQEAERFVVGYLDNRPCTRVGNCII